MSRVLILELRRSAAASAALILLLIGAVALFAATARWSPGWMSLAIVQREYTLLLWPLALAAGAWQGRREHRTKVAELFTSTSRPHAQRMTPTLGAMGIAVAAAYLVATAAGAVWIADTARGLPVAFFLTVGVGALSLVAAACIGLGVGRLWPVLATAPALAVAGLALIMIVPFGFSGRQWLGMVISPTWNMGMFSDYQTVGDRVSAAQALWALGLAAAGAVLFLSRGLRARTTALLPLVLGAAAAVAVIPHGDEAQLTPIDPVARELVCTDDAPRVCVSRVHAAVLPEVTPPARQALAAVAKLPGAPVSVQEDTSTYWPVSLPAPQRADLMLVVIRIDKNGGLAHRATVLPETVTGAFRSLGECDNRGYEPAIARAAAFYLMGTEPLSDEQVVPETLSEEPGLNDEAIALWQALRQLPEQEALRRVSAVWTAARECGDMEGMLSR